MDIFISHHSRDEHLAVHLKKLLDQIFNRTHDIFLSSELPGGANWMRAIGAFIDRKPYTIVIVTKTSVKRPWVWLEIGAAWKVGATVVPLCRKNVRLPDPLKRLTSRRLTHDGLAKLCRDVGKECGAKVDYGHARETAKRVFGRL
jgi:hypothetical protein